MKTQLNFQADIYQEIYIEKNDEGQFIPLVHQHKGFFSLKKRKSIP